MKDFLVMRSTRYKGSTGTRVVAQNNQSAKKEASDKVQEVTPQ